MASTLASRQPESQHAAAERHSAAILYARLRNFTRLSDMLDPQTVLHLVGEFFALVTRIAGSNDGQVLATHNDSLMAVFDAGSPAQEAMGSVSAAREIQVEFGMLAESWEQSYGLHTAVALGAHLGDTVFGFCGPEGDERLVAFGHTLTIAARLVHRARAGEFIMSDAVIAALAGTNFDLDAKPLPPLELPRRAPIRLYGVLLDTRLDFTQRS
jgi:class 3 adenylate cyclase